MRKINAFILIFFLSSIHIAHSEEIFTWKECVSEAIKNHPDLISASESVKQAEEDRSIEISSSLLQIESDMVAKSAMAATGVTTDTYSYSVTGEQLVFDGFKTSHDISSLSKTIDAQGYSYRVTSSNTRLNLRSAFIELLKAQELVSLTKDILERRKENLKLVKLRYEAGREHRGSLLTAEADLASAEYETEQAKRGISLTQRQLLKEMGLTQMRSIKVAGEFLVEKDYDIKPDFEYLTDNIPFLQQLIAKKEALRFDLKSEKADFLPQVYLDGSLGKSSSTWPPEEDKWSFGVSVSLPIFEGGSRIAEVKKAESKLRQAEADERSGRDSILVTLEDTWKDLQDTIENVSVQKKFLEANEERAKITAAQYETGLISFDDWIIIEDNLVNAKKAHLNAQANMVLGEAYWIQAIGGTLEYDEK